MLWLKSQVGSGASVGVAVASRSRSAAFRAYYGELKGVRSPVCMHVSTAVWIMWMQVRCTLMHT